MFLHLTRDGMAEMFGNGNLLGSAKSEETETGATTVDISLIDTFEDKVTISQVVCEPKPELERCEPTTEQTAEQPPAVSPTSSIANQSPETKAAPTPPAAQPLESKPQWTVGAQCQAVWSEDGKVYAATIQSIEGERCTVKFNGYGNEEDMPLCTLRPPELQSKSTQEWSAGLRCRAKFSDGLTYPAVVVAVQGQRCRVRFDHSNNEEELDVSNLLSPDELNGPGRTGRGATWRPAFGTGARRRREALDMTDKREAERGGRDRIYRDPQQAKERVQGQSTEEQESKERRPADKPTNQTFLPFPSFPPLPLPHCSGDVPAFVPPPPPFWAFGSKESSGPLDPTSHMLMLWYMCGFHTGSYLAQQQCKSSSKD